MPTPRSQRHIEAQVAYREAMALPKGPERDRAVREWSARFPEFESCGCAGNNVRLRRTK